MLSPYRVVDLTDEGVMICGQILGDLGADVILVEPSAGAHARWTGPYVDDLSDVDRSLNFWSLNRNKRSITLDLSTSYGRENLFRLVKTSDFLIESFTPGYLDRLGIGYQALAEINPALIMISITPFGQHGPKANWAATDLTATAASGVLFMTGHEDRPQGHVRLRFIFSCKDGHVNVTFLFGTVFGPSSRRLFEWIYEDGFCDAATRDKDWSGFGLHLMNGTEPAEELARCTECIERFTLSHTKAELSEGATRRKVLLVPVSNVEDLLRSEQLKSRQYWTKVEHPELGRQVTYPGTFAKFSQTPIQYRQRPPLLGEHTQEVLTEPRALVRFTPRPDGSFPPALEGLKVLDFTWIYAGPASTRYLADYGATVIRIESVKKIDATRTVAPFKDGHAGIERSAIYCNLNIGKYGVSLNLATSEAREVAMRLVNWADVVIENFSPKAMQAWGMDYESLRKIKPDLIMLSSCLNGQTGPHRMLAGYGTMGACMAGFGELTGWPDRPPAAPFSAYTDFTSPKFITAALLAALDHKRRTGHGQHIDVSQVEAPIHLLARAVLDYTVNGRIQTRMGNALREYAPTGVYPCAGTDRWVALAAPTDAVWRALCAASGRGWGGDPRFANASARLEHRAPLDEEIASWTIGFEPDALEEILQGVNVPVHRVSTSADILADPQIEARRHIIMLDHPRLGRVPVETSRMRFSRTPATAAWPGPEIGQHNNYVLRELLGLTDEEIMDLVVDEAVA